MRLFGWFRGDESQDDDALWNAEDRAEAQAQREMQVLKDVCYHIDAINSLMDQLPRGIKPWMLWRPCRLVLSKIGEIDREVLHGDGFNRLDFS